MRLPSTGSLDSWLEERCEKVWQRASQNEASTVGFVRMTLRPTNVISSHESKEPVDGSLITDLDSYFEALCDFYLRGSAENKARVPKSDGVQQAAGRKPP